MRPLEERSFTEGPSSPSSSLPHGPKIVEQQDTTIDNRHDGSTPTKITATSDAESNPVHRPLSLRRYPLGVFRHIPSTSALICLRHPIRTFRHMVRNSRILVSFTAKINKPSRERVYEEQDWARIESIMTSPPAISQARLARHFTESSPTSIS